MIAVMAAAGVCALPASAQQSFNCDRSYGFRADVGSTAGQTLCSSRVDTFLDAAKNFGLSNLGYTQTSPAQVTGRINDVGIILAYQQSSNTLSYRFPELGEAGSFTGANRDLSEDQFVDFLKKSDIIGRIMNYQAKHSATSAITGVGGAIPMAGAADFSASFDPMSQVTTGAGGQGDSGGGNLIGIGLGYASYNISGSGDKVKSTNLPLSYTIRNDIDPRRQLVFSMPLSQVKIGDADSYHAGLGVSYRFPLNDHWTLTPGGKYSVVGSKDRATLSTVMSANLMSTYVIPQGSNAIAIGNMLGYYKTGKISSGDYAFNPDIALTMARNGVMYSMPTSAFGGKMAAEFSLIDTRYLGDKPFVDNTQEIGVTIGTNRKASNARSYTRAGLSYIRGKDTRGLTVNLGYWF
ncbi:MAG: hypothetical protein V4724_35920 [Pseudomonadota bacterium]